jgi:hypothetical protein
MTVEEAQRIIDVILERDVFLIEQGLLTDKENGELWALWDSIDGNPPKQHMPYKDADFITYCATKADRAMTL